MSNALAGVPLILVAVLLVSGVAKLRNPTSTADAFVSLRLPPILTRLRAPSILPWGEIVLACVMAFCGGALQVAGSVAAILLFACYLLVIVRAVRFDEDVACACFGALGLGTVSTRTSVRNVVFLVLAVIAGIRAAVDTRSVVSAVTSDGDWAWVAIQVATAVVTWFIVAGSDTQSASAPPPPEAGELDFERTPIPYLQVTTPSGESVTLRSLAAPKAQALIVLSLTCGPCIRVRDQLADFAVQNPELDVRMVVTRQPAAADVPDGVSYLVDQQNEVGRVFELRTPGMVVLGTDDRIAAGPSRGESEVVALMNAVSTALNEARSEASPAE